MKSWGLERDVRSPKIFRKGDIVSHHKYGEGVVVGRWGSLFVETFRGKGGKLVPLHIDCSHILTVEFEACYHSCKEEYLQPI